MPEGISGEFDLDISDPLLDVVVRNAPVVLFATDRDGVLVLSRGRALDALGLRQGELVGRSVFELYTDEPAVAEGARRALAGEAVTVPLRLDGVVHETVFAPIRGEDGGVTGLVGVATDVTERVRAQEELQRRLQFDESTGLANRTRLVQLVDEAIRWARASTLSVAVVAVRLAQYRDVAETMGHAQAEAAVREVAHRLTALLPADASLGRLDTGRFAVLLRPGVSPSEAMAVAAHTVEALRPPYQVGGRHVDMHPLAGIAMYPGHASTGEALVRRAEATLALAARNVEGYAIYSSTRQAAQAENLRLLGDLQRALEQGEIGLHYQPLVDLRSARVHAVEALARWDHAELGPVAPERFVALAESSGLIRGLTRYVLGRAARQARLWQQAGVPLRVDVNVSPRDVLDQRFVHDVEASLETWGLDPRWLAVEVTERAMVDDPRTTSERLGVLDAMGMHLAIDDFGTGHSNMTTLKQLPFHSIKIDRSFVSGLPAGEHDRAIVGSVAALASAMGRETTAEGVETPEAWDGLIDLGCATAQGYHIARPMPAEQVLPWLASGPWAAGSA